MGNEIAKLDAGVRDVADHFNVHPATVRTWAETTDLPHVKIGRVYRFNLRAVVAWANHQTARPAA